MSTSSSPAVEWRIIIVPPNTPIIAQVTSWITATPFKPQGASGILLPTENDHPGLFLVDATEALKFMRRGRDGSFDFFQLGFRTGPKELTFNFCFPKPWNGSKL